MKNMKKRIEFIMVKPVIDTYCNSVKDILDALSLDENIEVDTSSSYFKYITKKKREEIIIYYEIKTGTIEGHGNRYFIFAIEFDSKTNRDNFKFIEFYDVLIDRCSKFQEGTTIHTLWNDVKKEYTTLAYEEIFEIENLLRRFINKLLLIKVGFNWTEEVLPDDVIRRDKKNEIDSGILNYIYFSDLSKIIFSGQRKKGLRNIGDIQKIVEGKLSKNEEMIPVGDLIGTIKTSIWDKYFVDEKKNKKSKNLETYLDELNDLRNEVAHSKFINIEELMSIKKLTKNIKDILNLAFNDLDSVIISSDDKQNTLVAVNDAQINFEESEQMAIAKSKEILERRYGDLDIELLPNNGPADAIFSGTDENIKIGLEVKRSIRSRSQLISIAKLIGRIMNQYNVEVFALCIIQYSHIKAVDVELEDILNRSGFTTYPKIEVIYLNSRIE